MRLAKYIADSGISSRRRAEEMILAGQVEVNGQPAVQVHVKVNPELDQVRVNGRLIQSVHKVYLLLNKPGGYLCSVGDPHGRPTVTDLVKDAGLRLYPVGRLDMDTEGLLLMSNDGDFMNLMTHPRYHIPKTYQAWVCGHVGNKAMNSLRRGIQLEDGMTAPARTKILESGNDRELVEVVLYEGRKRQIKRMFKAIGHPVLALQRTAFGFLTLKNLAVGQYRHLSATEVEKLKSMARGISQPL